MRRIILRGYSYLSSSLSNPFHRPFKSVSSVSIRVRLFLQQVVADEFEGVLAGPPANAFAVAGKIKLFDLSVLIVGECDVDEADRFVGVGAGSSGAWAGDAGDGDAERCAGAGADAFGEGARYFARDGAFAGDE